MSFSDDTQLYVFFSPEDEMGQLDAIAAIERCVQVIRNWMWDNRLLLNEDKTEFLLIGTKLSSGILPGKWKEANVCAVFKKGKKCDPGNYRPISLTCIASKILEHIVHSHLMKHLERHGILIDNQHGFRAKRSTETQLICTVHDITHAIQQNKQVNLAILDFSKAFDPAPEIIDEVGVLWDPGITSRMV